MSYFAWILAIWFAVSIPAALFVAALISNGDFDADQ